MTLRRIMYRQIMQAAIAAMILLFALPSASSQPSLVPANAKGFPLVGEAGTATIFIDTEDAPGVARVANDLASDIERVTAHKPSVASGEPRGTAVLIGTIGHSRWIDQLIARKQIDVSAIAGQWEASLSTVVDHPFPGVEQALVLVGSDRRGAIYATYDLSQAIGVSPWYWWADVPVRHQTALVLDRLPHLAPSPAVRYRGIFLNDEAPALSGWAHEKFGGLNHVFYEHVFELILRLRGNYLWPAMWGNAFNEDDPLNPRIAYEYGIVMGTSHHEPMIRAQQEWKRHGTGPWNYETNGEVLRKFWEQGIVRNQAYESTVTVGMRGDGDEPMTAGQNIALLERIVRDQRSILSAHDIRDPQVWALYKEVQGYYEKGMRVPDDVTLLWSDDNWGNLRRLPTADERLRTGGAGIYYHFDYVGDPRNYKWINVTNIAKVWEQMERAREFGADRIWIVNVGDLKPMEFPIEFFLTMARRPEGFSPATLHTYTVDWAARTFDPAHAQDIASLIERYEKLIARRTPELLAPDTYSVASGEADRVEAEWQQLQASAEKLEMEMSAEQRDAYFELVLHPITAAATVNSLWIETGRNHLYARQGRSGANDAADRVRALFAADAQLTDRYNHQLAHGKWDHMMDQTHIGYTFWNEPPTNILPSLEKVTPQSGPRMDASVEGSDATASNGQLALPVFDAQALQSSWIEVFNRGAVAFDFTARADQPWIQLATNSGHVDKQQRIAVTIDPARLPHGTSSGTIALQQTDGPTLLVHVTAVRPEAEAHGFIETRNVIAMEAEHFDAQRNSNSASWKVIPNYGKTLSGMTIFPLNAPSNPTPEHAPTLDYRLTTRATGQYTLSVVAGPSLNYVPGRGLRLAVSLDDAPWQFVDLLATNTNAAWAESVRNAVRRVHVPIAVPSAGLHTLHVAMVDSGVVLERLELGQGTQPSTYLGPSESVRLP